MTHQIHHRSAPIHHTDPCRRFPFHKTRLFRGPTVDQPRAWLPSLWWLSVLFLGSVSLLLMAWGAYSLTPNSSEKDLRVAVVSPKLSIKGGVEPPRKPAPTKQAGAAPKEKDVLEPLSAHLPPPILPAPMPIEPIPVVPPPAPLPPRATPQSEPMKIELQLPALPPVLELPSAPLPKIEPPAPKIEKSKGGPLVPLPKAPDVVPPPPVAVEATAPMLPEHPLPFVARTVNPGDTPMMRNWKMVAFYSLLASALGQTPAVAGEKSDSAEILKKLDKLQKTSDEIKSDVNGLKTEISNLKFDVEKLQGDFTSISKQVGSNKIKIDDLENQIKDLKIKVGLGNAAASGPDKTVWDELKTKLSNIEQTLTRLQPTEIRKALSPPLNSATGRIVLVNVYGERLMFLLNGKPYAVEPNTTLPVNDMPPGPMTYEVRSPTYGIVSRSTTMLNANDLFTLTAR